MAEYDWVWMGRVFISFLHRNLMYVIPVRSFDSHLHMQAVHLRQLDGILPYRNVFRTGVKRPQERSTQNFVIDNREQKGKPFRSIKCPSPCVCVLKKNVNLTAFGNWWAVIRVMYIYIPCPLPHTGAVAAQQIHELNVWKTYYAVMLVPTRKIYNLGERLSEKLFPQCENVPYIFGTTAECIKMSCMLGRKKKKYTQCCSRRSKTKANILYIISIGGWCHIVSCCPVIWTVWSIKYDVEQRITAYEFWLNGMAALIRTFPHDCWSGHLAWRLLHEQHLAFAEIFVSNKFHIFTIIPWKWNVLVCL